MKALTICQPYAALILLPEGDPRRKRVENRTWCTKYRGPFYIHAGKSKAWLSGDFQTDYCIHPEQMTFGAIVGTAELIDCLPIDQILKGHHRDTYPWLQEHQHTGGPWCWILDNVVAIDPWPWRGAQGLFDVPALGEAT